MKDKVEMTQGLINQLHKDGWLSKKLKQEYMINGHILVSVGVTEHSSLFSTTLN